MTDAHQAFTNAQWQRIEPSMPPCKGRPGGLSAMNLESLSAINGMRRMPETWQVKVIGHVQGVSYRDACICYARAQGITGWMRNRIDGSVELMLQGFKAQLAAMCSWLRHGIPAARVDKLEVSDVPLPAPRLDNFDRLPTL